MQKYRLSGDLIQVKRPIMFRREAVCKKKETKDMIFDNNLQV